MTSPCKKNGTDCPKMRGVESRMKEKSKAEDVATVLEKEASTLMDIADLNDPEVVYSIEEKMKMAEMLRNIKNMPKLKRGRPRKELV